MSTSPESKLHFLDYWRTIRVRKGLICLIFLLVVITVGVLTYLSPKEYLSFATIEVQPDMTPVRIFNNTQTDDTTHDPKFTQTQFQIILRKGVLYPVIERLQLQTKWARQGQPLPAEIAYDRLRSMLQLQEIRNTNLIQISVYSTDPQEAALLANTIAQEYMEQRIGEEQTIISQGLDQIKDEVKQKEEAVRQAFAEASQLRTEANIVDPNPDSMDNSARVEDSTVLANQEKVNDQRAQVATLQSRLNELDRLKSEDLMRAASLFNLNDPILEQKVPIYQTAVAERARLLNSGLGRNHPDVKALQAQIDTIEQQLREQIESIRKGLVSQLAIAQSSLQQLEQNLNNSQTDQEQKKTASAKYLDAKYRYLQERQLLEAAKTKLNTETMERTMPQKPASIRDAAEPALFPSKPKVFLNMFLGCLAGLALGLGTAFFLEYLDTSVKTMEQVEALLGLPVLAIIPRNVSNLVTTSPDSPDGEAYRILKTNADFTRKKVVASVFSITSGGPSEGKSTTVCNLATSYAQSGQQTLIIDADLRRPSQHELLSLPNEAGLSDYLHDTSKLEDVIQVTTVQNLFTITSGSRPIESVSLLNSDRFKQLLATAKEWFDVVLVDCPPLLGLSDATIVCSMTEATIIVAQHRRFPRSMLVRVKGLLTGIEANILGVVLNNVDVRQDPAYQYYTSYSKYYTGTKKKRKSPAGPVTTGRTYQPPSSNGSKSGTTTTISRISTKRPSFSAPEPESKKETDTDQEDVY